MFKLTTLVEDVSVCIFFVLGLNFTWYFVSTNLEASLDSLVSTN